MNKNYVISAIVALVVSLGIGLVFPTETTPYQSNDELGSVRQTIDTFVNGIGFRGGSKNLIGGTIGTGKNQASWKNTTGKDAYFTAGFAIPIATSTSVNGPLASSTMRVLMGTSTASTIDNYANPATQSTGVFMTWIVATSTGSQSLAASSTATYGGLGNAGTKNVVRVKNNEYFNVAIIAGQSGVPSATICVAGGACEPATSTARGYNLRWFAEYITLP